MGGELFDRAFEAFTGNAPFGWQRRLFTKFFLPGDIPSALDIPTGLGKTSVIVVWLIALAQQAESGGVRLPRRLVYVVNRRTVVDQATDIAEGLRRRLCVALDKAVVDAKDDEVITRWQAAERAAVTRVAETLLGLSLDCEDKHRRLRLARCAASAPITENGRPTPRVQPSLSAQSI